jgi:hypothetical protein
LQREKNTLISNNLAVYQEVRAFLPNVQYRFGIVVQMDASSDYPVDVDSPV